MVANHSSLAISAAWILFLSGAGFACSSDDDADSAAGASSAGTSMVDPPAAGSTMTSAGSTSTGSNAGSTSGEPNAGSASTAGSNANPNGEAGTSASAGSGNTEIPSDPFSFFVTSYAAMVRLSGSDDGFGGDLRYGQADGLSGADKICSEIAEGSLAGSGQKDWRAFLSVTKGADGNPVHAIDRVGQGPWYDRLGRLVAMNKADLMTERPTGMDSAIVNDFPNEDGVPNHAPDGEQVDNHDTLTGTNTEGQLFDSDWSVTCHDWTSAVGSDGKPRVGHSWPRGGGGGRGGMGRPAGGGSGNNWMSALDEAGCAPGASLIEMGGPDPSIPTVGSGGGYGAIYCFALQP